MRVLCTVIVAVALGASISAQRQGAGAQPGARPAPRIDPLSASIHGRVTAADGGAPIRRAEVRAMAEGGGITRLTTTDADGQYELRDLPAGTYRLAISRSGFVTLHVGQRRPAEAVRAVELAEGQRVAANMALPRGGAIAGRVVDEAGEPVADVRVQAMRSRTIEGRRRVMPVGVIDTTDDTGAFRLYGLEPGDYYVAAMVRSPTPEDARMSAVTGPLRGDIKGTVPMFFPGVTGLELAQLVSLAVSAEARADIFLSPLRAATVSGVVVDSNGVVAADARIDLRSDALDWGFSAAHAGPPPIAISAHTAPDGTFELPNVPPGAYTLIARLQSPAARAAMDTFSTVIATGVMPAPALMDKTMMDTIGEVALMPLVVADADVSGLTLAASRPGMLTGRFVADTGVTRPLPGRLSLEASNLETAATEHVTMLTDEIRLAGLAGPTRLRVVNLPQAWTVKAITLDGTDVTDTPIDVRGNVDVRVVLTDRVAEVSGVIMPPTRDPREAVGDASREYYVVVFAADAAKWTYPSRFVRSVRTDAQNAFRISGLPGNERYLAVAVDYLGDGEAEDPEFLERIRNRAVPFSLNDGERKTIEARVVAR